VRTSRRDAESAAPRSPLLRVVMGVLVLFVLALVGLKFSSGRSGPPRIDSDVRGESDAAMLFAEAKALIRQGKWAAAKVKLEAVRAEDEDYVPSQIDNYLKIVNEELPNEERFATAADAIAKGELGRAATALSQVKTTTQDRALTDAKQALSQKVEARRSEARGLLATSQWAALLKLSDDLLVAVPGDRDASEWKQQAEQAIARGKRGPVKVVSTETPWGARVGSGVLEAVREVPRLREWAVGARGEDRAVGVVERPRPADGVQARPRAGRWLVE
jgi:hypothetical protein